MWIYLNKPHDIFLNGPHMKAKIDKPTQEKIIKLYSEGNGSDAISKIINVHSNTVLKILKQNGIDIRPATKLSLYDLQKMHQMYFRQFIPYSEIGKMFNLTHSGVRQALIRNKEKLNSIESKIGYEKPLVLDDIILNKNYIKSISDNEKELLSQKILIEFKKSNFNYNIDFDPSVEFKKIKESQLQIKENNVIPASFNCGIKLCKAFCPELYFTKFKNRKSIMDALNNDEDVIKGIKYILGIDKKSTNKIIKDVCFKNLVYGLISSATSLNISLFKPSIAKLIYEKYTLEDDVIFDPSAGWGGRMLGAAALQRKYIGIDPLTANSINILSSQLNLNNIKIIHGKSEDVLLGENMIDFVFTSPPYYDLEKYSEHKSQAYNKGEHYFYNVYWKKTLKNIKKMLKHNKVLGLHLNVDKMLEEACKQFGEPFEELKIELRTSHLHKSKGQFKYEKILMFRNNKDV